MPSADTVLLWATGVANDWRWLAIGWHIALAFLLAVMGGSRVSQRLWALMLLLPIVSVTVVAAVSGNPFNALTFAILSVVLVRSAVHLPTAHPEAASRKWMLAGVPLIAVGWFYPHFLVTDTWLEYAYASPFGLLPCPTLSVVVGLTLVRGDFRSTSWNAVLGAAGMLYGAIGVFSLGVLLDVWLLVGAAVVATWALAELIVRRVRATKAERTRWLPGDEFIPAPAGAMTNAITLNARPGVVWPWLVQMGAGTRAGWYSYDFLDNGRRPSARRIIPELQRICVGDIFPALPGITEGFILLALERERSLVLGWRNPNGSPMVTWTFVLESRPDCATRLIVRVRHQPRDRALRFPLFVRKLQHFVMQRKQLLEIARRVEWTTAALPRAA